MKPRSLFCSTKCLKHKDAQFTERQTGKSKVSLMQVFLQKRNNLELILSIGR